MGGAMPTRTSVEISIGTDKANVPAATERQAGVMTAEHVAALEDLRRWRVGVETGTDAGDLRTDIITREELTAESARIVEAVKVATRGALQSLESKVAQIQSQPAIGGAPVDFEPLRQEISSVALAATDGIVALTRHQQDTERRVANLEEILRSLAAHLGIEAQGRAA